jgi:hypothetical protein
MPMPEAPAVKPTQYRSQSLGQQVTHTAYLPMIARSDYFLVMGAAEPTISQRTVGFEHMQLCRLAVTAFSRSV